MAISTKQTKKMAFGKQLEFSSTDFEIRTADSGKEYISLRPHISFSDSAIADAKACGVQPAYAKHKPGEEDDENE